MFRDIIWDFDGTLCDTYPVTASALHDCLAKRGIDLRYSDLYGMLKISIAKTVAACNERYRLKNDFWDEYDERRLELELTECPPYSGTKELLGDIVSSGGRNFIWTHRGNDLYRILDANNMRGYFEGFVTVNNGFPLKPNPAGALYLIEKYEINPGTALLVGDRKIDINAGKNAGISTANYWDGTGEKVPDADYFAENMEDMRRIIGL